MPDPPIFLSSPEVPAGRVIFISRLSHLVTARGVLQTESNLRARDWWRTDHTGENFYDLSQRAVIDLKKKGAERETRIRDAHKRTVGRERYRHSRLNDNKRAVRLSRKP